MKTAEEYWHNEFLKVMNYWYDRSRPNMGKAEFRATVERQAPVSSEAENGEKVGTFWFIEHPDTHEWYYVKREYQESYRTDLPGTEALIPSWTKDPLQASRFESKETAQSFAQYDTIFDRTFRYIITEHEFVCTHGRGI